MQIAALGVGTASVHTLALQATPEVVQPQVLPAPSVVALHKANVAREYVVQAAATAQAVPLNAQVLR